MGNRVLPYGQAYRKCLDHRERLKSDPHLAFGRLNGLGRVLIFDPHSQEPKETWIDGKRPPGLPSSSARFTYTRVKLRTLMLEHDIKYLIVVHGGVKGSISRSINRNFWKGWFHQVFSDSNPIYLDEKEAITLLSPPDPPD